MIVLVDEVSKRMVFAKTGIILVDSSDAATRRLDPDSDIPTYFWRVVWGLVQR